VTVQIQKNKPKLDIEYTDRLARALIKYSKKHNVKVELLAAILMQESRYNVGAINHKSKDYGIGQINKKTIKNFKFDQTRILTDVEYSVEAAAIVLADFKRMYGKREAQYWTRYNASDKTKRQVYGKLVARYM
jgi:soluble lytic murein transglycosylase-like protein